MASSKILLVTKGGTYCSTSDFKVAAMFRRCDSKCCLVFASRANFGRDTPPLSPFCLLMEDMIVKSDTGSTKDDAFELHTGQCLSGELSFPTKIPPHGPQRWAPRLINAC